MRIAFILLCHKNAAQVDELIQALSASSTDFYIHVDKKTPEFKLFAFQNVFLVPDDMRIDIQWGRNSMVNATLSAIDYMFASGKTYDYVCLLSGQDFPIKNTSAIISYLEENKGLNFIEVLDHLDPRFVKYSKRNAIVYPFWMQNRSVLSRIAKRAYIYLTGGYNYTLPFVKRRAIKNLEFEFGSQWWCLTYDCLRWIRDYIEERPEVSDFFEYALVPDECLFQTVFMTSPYKNTRRDSLTYLEWDKNQNNPRIFGVEDYFVLLNSQKLFARKFDTNVDADIIAMLQQIQIDGIQKG